MTAPSTACAGADLLAGALARLEGRGEGPAIRPIRQVGTVCDVTGLTVRVRCLPVPVGSLCLISVHTPYVGGLPQGDPVGVPRPVSSGRADPGVGEDPAGQVRPGHTSAHPGTRTARLAGRGSLLAEVVGFARDHTILMTYGSVEGVRPGDRVRCLTQEQRIPVGAGLLGRVLDGNGRPADGRGPLLAEAHLPLYLSPPDAVRRQAITQPLATGVRAIDGLLTCGKGQRMGIFSGAGVGKSVLLGMIARHTQAEVNVVALIGERGREVRAFLDDDLGPEGLARSVVVVSTSYDPAPLRVKAGFVAATIADYFRDQGLDVMFLVDSVTRVALAQREVGLSAGEPPATRGHPPSVFALLPRLLERAGCSERGTVTGFYNVLVEGDDIDEPISDACRGVLDGHIWLDRRLASRRHYPAVSVLDSVSRLMPAVTEPAHREAADRIAALLARYREAEDLIAIGAYVKGSDDLVDLAIEMRPRIEAFLRQAVTEGSPFEVTRGALVELSAAAEKAASLKPRTQSLEPRGPRLAARGGDQRKGGRR